jgi:hypothetical protein
VNKLQKIRSWISNNRELFYLAAVVALLTIAYPFAQLQDSRVGWDGWSDMLYILSQAVKGFAIVFCAYLSKMATSGETTAQQDRDMRDKILSGDKWALVAYWQEITITGLWIVFWAWVLRG